MLSLLVSCQDCFFKIEKTLVQVETRALLKVLRSVRKAARTQMAAHIGLSRGKGREEEVCLMLMMTKELVEEVFT